MTPQTAHSSVPAQNMDIRPPHKDKVIADLQSAAEGLERALSGLRVLSADPDYAALASLIPGYDWALDQIHELNTGLIYKSGAEPDTDH